VEEVTWVFDWGSQNLGAFQRHAIDISSSQIALLLLLPAEGERRKKEAAEMTSDVRGYYKCIHIRNA
jgi:hypothetical protein